MGKIAVVDYGVGNLMSVTNALSYLGLNNVVTSDRGEIEKADGIILPGVGAFGNAARQLVEHGFDSLLKAQAEVKPMLGVCVGMQLLFESSSEMGQHGGLGIIPGRVRRIKTGLKLPHMGWNSLEIKKECPIFRGLNGGEYVYFVHSYCAEVEDPGDVSATVEYSENFAVSVSRGNVFGLQFHPEKSGECGLEILKNFGDLI